MLVTNPGKYAQAERERRFLMPTMPTGLGDPWEIHDRYIIGKRLRLRRVEASEGTALSGMASSERMSGGGRAFNGR